VSNVAAVLLARKRTKSDDTINKIAYKNNNEIIFKYKGVRTNAKFPLAPMGVLSTGSAHARPSTLPLIDTSGNFSARVSAESPSNILPNPSEVISEVSQPLDNFFKYPPFSAHSAGGMGG
jgi:hypothetical protein